MKDSWRIWEGYKIYGDILYKRAIGELEEMESAKSLSRILKELYRPGMKVLDAGCGAGHYLRSLRARVDRDIDYTGADATEYYIEKAKEAFPESAAFKVSDITDLSFDSSTFDIVMSNNVLLHLPPPPRKAISELIRVSRKHVVIRTVFGERNYIIKECRNPDEVYGESGKNRLSERQLIKDDGQPVSFNYFNLYTENYLRDIVSELAPGIEIKIIPDSFGSFDNREVGGHTATKVEGDRQISGNLILDWRFIVLTKRP